MGYPPTFDNVYDLFSSPADKAEEGAEGVGDDEDAVPTASGSVDQNLAKRIFSQVGAGGDPGTQAHIDVYRSVSETRGDKSGIRVMSQQVQISGKPLQEYRFIVTSTQLQNAERFTVRSTFGDAPEIAHGFGEKPKIWQFQGILRSGSGKTKWRRALETFYRSRLRPTKMMRHNEFVRFRVGDMSMRGYIMNFNTSQSEKMDPAMARFQFSMYVRSYRYEGGGYSYTPSSNQLTADNPVFGSAGTEGDGEGSGSAPPESG